VCHRDLKPDNVMINLKSKAIKLMDFNISRRFMNKDGIRNELRTQTGLDLWSAPETRQGGKYTEAVDMWGIGVITYFLLMKLPPFISTDEV